MVINLNQSMMDGRKVKILRDSIKRAEENRDTFLFGMELSISCIMYLENRISEKMGVMLLLEGICRHPTGVGVKAYFNKL